MTEVFNSPSERLDEVIKDSLKNRTNFAAECGLNPSNVLKMLKGEQTISVRTAEKIQDRFGYSAEYILFGTGEMKPKGLILHEIQERGIPYFDELPVSAGQLDLANIEYEERPTQFVNFPGLKDGSFAFPVVGCSMEPTIKSGEVVVVTDVNNWERVDPDKVYLIITQDDRMIKHLSIDNNNSDILWCMSDNENYGKFRISKSEIKKIYRVTFHGSLL